MKIILQRCTHCGCKYEYQASGGNAGPFNDGKWCTNCKEVVSTALSTIPRRFESRYQNVKEIPRLKDVTIDMLLQWDEERRKDSSDPWGSMIQRIWPGLFDLNTGDHMSIREIRGRNHPIFNGIPFRLSSWDKKKEHTIEAPMEYDLERGEFTGYSWSH